MGRPPEISGADLTDTDRQLARELADFGCDDLKGRLKSFWLFTRKPSPNNDALDKICSRGLASVPLLLTLHNDNWLTNTPRPPGNRRLEAKPRPPGWYSRGEIADHLLASLSPEDYDTPMSPELVAVRTKSWLAARKAKTARQLAFDYLDGGRPQAGGGVGVPVGRPLHRGGQATRGLLPGRGKDQQDRPLVSGAIPPGARPGGRRTSWKNYLEIRERLNPGAPKGCLHRRPKRQAPQPGSPDGTSRPSLTACLSGKLKWDDPLETELAGKLRSPASKTPLRLALDSARRAQDPVLRSKLLQLLTNWHGKGTPASYKDNAELWEALLADQRPSPEHPGMSVGANCQMLMAFIYADPTELYALNSQLGRTPFPEASQSGVRRPPRRTVAPQTYPRPGSAAAGAEDGAGQAQPGGLLGLCRHARRRRGAGRRRAAGGPPANQRQVPAAGQHHQRARARPGTRRQVRPAPGAQRASACPAKCWSWRRWRSKPAPTLPRRWTSIAAPYLEGTKLKAESVASNPFQLPEEKAKGSAAPSRFRLEASISFGFNTVTTTLARFRLEGEALVPDDSGAKEEPDEVRPEKFYTILEKALSTGPVNIEFNASLTLRQE